MTPKNLPTKEQENHVPDLVFRGGTGGSFCPKWLAARLPRRVIFLLHQGLGVLNLLEPTDQCPHGVGAWG
jgi:hypothetical protein